MNQVTKAQLAAIIRPRIEEILDLMRRRLAACAHASEAAQSIVLTGGGSQLTGLAELASNMFGRPVRLGRPRAPERIADGGTVPDFAAASASVNNGRAATTSSPAAAEQRYLGTGTGYFATRR